MKSKKMNKSNKKRLYKKVAKGVYQMGVKSYHVSKMKDGVITRSVHTTITAAKRAYKEML